MIAALMTALTAAAALFVLWPLFRSPGDAAPGWSAERERLLRDRDAAYHALRDLELDRATGKLSDADYAGLAGQYRARALGVLRRIESLAERSAPAQTRRSRADMMPGSPAPNDGGPGH
jgi:hypothetical protein